MKYKVTSEETETVKSTLVIKEDLMSSVKIWGE